MKITVKKQLQHLPEGEYSGKIISQNCKEDSNYIWLSIAIDETDEILNISVYAYDSVFQNFAVNLADNEGNFDTEQLVNLIVKFSLKDKETSSGLFSKIVELEEINNAKD